MPRKGLIASLTACLCRIVSFLLARTLQTQNGRLSVFDIEPAVDLKMDQTQNASFIEN